ncbi:MAG: DNA cytosine methyltransferase, partial [Bacteroidetes bacterium]|nr:DNA cytosine methyltransferase [Bacteroidota bacterium]
MKLKKSSKKESKSYLESLSLMDQAVLTHHLHNSESVYAKGAELIFQNYFEETPEVYNALQTEIFEKKAPFLGPKKGTEKFTFIDLFAGIGGFRMALQELEGRCIFSSEWDKEAQKTYRVNFGEVPFGDITKKETKEFIPDGFEVLCAGFPCQAF